jgi:hypothetical protein
MAEVSIQDLQKKCDHYERLLGVGEYDPVKSAFVVYMKMLNQQTSYLNEFNLKSKIATTDKEAPEYKRAMDMFDGLPKAITAVNDLRATLKLTKEDIKQIEGDNVIFSKITTPETIADSVGSPAGMNK